MTPNAFFPQTCNLLVSQKKYAKRLFSTLHHLSPVICATATVVAFVLLRNSRFTFHCYTQHEVTLTQKSAQKWCCNLSQLLGGKITKGIHLCKPASLNCPTEANWTCPAVTTKEFLFTGVFQPFKLNLYHVDRYIHERRWRKYMLLTNPKKPKVGMRVWTLLYFPS